MKNLDQILKIILNKYLLVKNLNGRSDHALRKRTLSAFTEVFHNYPLHSFRIGYLQRIWNALFSLFKTNDFLPLQPMIEEVIMQFLELIAINILNSEVNTIKEALLRKVLEEASFYSQNKAAFNSHKVQQSKVFQVGKEEKCLFMWNFILTLQQKVAQSSQNIYFNLCHLILKEQINFIYQGFLQSHNSIKQKSIQNLKEEQLNESKEEQIDEQQKKDFKQQNFSTGLLRLKYLTMRCKLLEVYFQYFKMRIDDFHFFFKVIKNILFCYELNKCKGLIKGLSQQSQQTQAKNANQPLTEQHLNKQKSLKHCLCLYKLINNLLQSKHVVFSLYAFSDLVSFNLPEYSCLLKTLFQECLNLHKLLHPFIENIELPMLLFIIRQTSLVEPSQEFSFKNTESNVSSDKTGPINLLKGKSQQIKIQQTKIQQTKIQQTIIQSYLYSDVIYFFRKGLRTELTYQERKEQEQLVFFYKTSTLFSQLEGIDINKLLAQSVYKNYHKDLLYSYNETLKSLYKGQSQQRFQEFQNQSQLDYDPSSTLIKDLKLLDQLSKKYTSKSVYQDLGLLFNSLKENIKTYLRQLIIQNFFYVIEVVSQEDLELIEACIQIKQQHLTSLQSNKEQFKKEIEVIDQKLRLSLEVEVDNKLSISQSAYMVFYSCFVLLCRSSEMDNRLLIKAFSVLVIYHEEVNQIFKSQFYKSYLEQYQNVSEDLYDCSISKEDSFQDALCKYLSEDEGVLSSYSREESPLHPKKQLFQKNQQNQQNSQNFQKGRSDQQLASRISKAAQSDLLSLKEQQYFVMHDILEHFFQGIQKTESQDLEEFERLLFEEVVYQQKLETQEEFDLLVVVIHVLLEIQIRTKNNQKMLYHQREYPFPLIQQYFKNLSRSLTKNLKNTQKKQVNVLEEETLLNQSFRKNNNPPKELIQQNLTQAKNKSELEIETQRNPEKDHFEKLRASRESQDKIPNLMLFLDFKQTLIKLQSGHPLELPTFKILLDQLQHRFQYITLKGFEIFLQDLVFCFINLEQSQVKVSPQKLNSLIKCWDQAQQLFKLFNKSISKNYQHEERFKLQKTVQNLVVQIINSLHQVNQIEELNVLSIVFIMIIDLIKINKSIKNEELLPVFIQYYQMMDQNPNLQGETKSQYFLFCLQTLGDNLQYFSSSFFAFHVYQMTILKTPYNKLSKEAEILLFQSVFDSVTQYCQFLNQKKDNEQLLPFYLLTTRLIKGRTATLIANRYNASHVWLLFLSLSLSYPEHIQAQLESPFKEILALMMKFKILDSKGASKFYQKEKDSNLLWKKSAKMAGESCSSLIKFFT